MQTTAKYSHNIWERKYSDGCDFSGFMPVEMYVLPTKFFVSAEVQVRVREKLFGLTTSNTE